MPEPVPTPLRRYVFTLTKADHEALLKRFERSISVSLVLAAAVCVGLAWGAMDPGWFGELALLPVIALAAVVLYGAALAWRAVARRRRAARWTPPAEPIEVSAFLDRVEAREGARTRVYAWGDIAGVSSDEGRAYLVKSHDDVVTLPLQAFGSRKALRDFVLFCDERMRATDAAEGPQPAPEAPAQVSAAALPGGGAGAREAVEFTLTGEDARHVEAALRPAGSSAPVRLPVAALIMGIAGGVIFGGPVWLAASGPADTRLFAGALAAWLGAILLTFLGARRIESARAAQWPADDPRRMPRRIEIDEAGFVSRGADFETRIAWAGVESIRETEQHVLFITRWKEVYAAPKRCFSDAEAGRAFANRARAYKMAS